jgi:hypothetical protein
MFLFLLFRLEDEGLGEKNGKWLKWIGVGGEERKVVKVDWGTGFTCYCNKLSLPQLVAELQPDL